MVRTTLNQTMFVNVTTVFALQLQASVRAECFTILFTVEKITVLISSPYCEQGIKEQKVKNLMMKLFQIIRRADFFCSVKK